MKRRYYLPFLLLVFLAGVGVYAAPDSVETYEPLQSAPYAFATDATTASSSLDFSTPLNQSTLRQTKGNPTIFVSGDLSGTAGDTVVIHCVLYRRTGTNAYSWLGTHTSTATAGAGLNGTDNAFPILFFDASSATHYEIRHAAPSAGQLDGWTWAGSSDPQ